MIPNLESNKGSIEYAITVTLSSKYRSRYKNDSVEDSYTKLNKELYSICKKYNLKLSLVVELHKDFTIHCHGFIKHIDLSKLEFQCYRNDLKRYIHEVFRKYNSNIIGFIYVKDITDYNVWHEYCIKELKYTNKVIAYSPIICDDLGSFTKEQFKLNFPQPNDLI